MQSFAERLARRTEFIEFVPDETRNGGAKPRLDGAIASLARQGEELKQRRRREPEDYHWEIIGSLVLQLKQRPQREPEDYHWEIIGSLVLCEYPSAHGNPYRFRGRP